MKQAENSGVTVIIPTCDRCDSLARCLASVRRQLPAPERIIVVDNGSQDGTSAMLAEMPDVDVIRNADNPGPAVARNQALARAHGDYAWFLDSDSEVLEPTVLAAMLEGFRRDPTIGAIGGEWVQTADSTRVQRVRYVTRNGQTSARSVPQEDTQLLDCDYLATSNALIRLDLLRRIGGFDPAYVFLGEDKQLGCDIRRLGYRNVSSAATSALHHIELDGRRSILQKQRNVIRYAFINSDWRDLVMLPLHEVRHWLGVPYWHEARRSARVIAKYSGSTPSHSLAGMLKLAVLYVGATLTAYGWAILTWPVLLRARFNRPDGLGVVPPVESKEAGHA